MPFLSVPFVVAQPSSAIFTPYPQHVQFSAAALVIALLGFTQAQPVEERKHVMLTGGFTAPKGSALNVWREGSYPSIVRFKGDVEIKAKGFILRADEADFHEARLPRPTGGPQHES